MRARLETAARSPIGAITFERLAVLAFLHDAGKLHPGFQAKGWPAGIWKRPVAGHVREGAEIFFSEPEIARNLCLEELCAWGIGEGALLFSVLSHHGRPISVHDLRNEPWGVSSADGWHYDPVEASVELGRMIRRWFPLAFADSNDRLPETPAFQHLFCGFVSLADWLGSDNGVFRYVGALDEDYIEKARNLARQTITSRHIDAAQFRRMIIGRSAFSDITGFGRPRPHQALIGTCPLDEQLVILEAETGSGKTEAALWRFVRLFEAGKVDSLYFALPTRAAALQLHRRVNAVLKRLFGDRTLEAVLAVPGYLRIGDADGEALPDWRVRWDDDADEALLQARWAAENTKRYLAATVAVGTVDQAMLAGLQVKHAHLRSAALARSLLVVDEIHASDGYMTGVLGHLLKAHLGWGGYAMLMSATLGSVARHKWLGGKELPAFSEAVATPYPAVWLRKELNPRSAPRDASQKAITMRMVATMAPESAAVEAIAAASAGARVLVIRNTVHAAIATWQGVRDAGAERLLLQVGDGPALHHSRFAQEDRKLLDEAVEDALSPKARKSEGIIIIGTQTLEQSLDIDADLLITDLCPVDVLLQRIGRLHRHKLTRPGGFETPQCVVMAPHNGLAPLLKPAFENGLGAWKENNVYVGIYADLSVLELTRRLIVDHPCWTIPEMNRLLVESATHPERIVTLHDELGKPWADYWQQTYGKEIADVGAGRRVALPVSEPFGEFKFPSDEQDIRTRLGADGAKVTFSETVEGPFGQPVSGIVLPGHWSHGIDASEPATVIYRSGEFQFAVGQHIFCYSRKGLLRISSE